MADMNDLHERMGLLLGKQEAMDEKLDGMISSHDRLDDRVGKLESTKNMVVGAWIFASGVAAIIVSDGFNKVKNFIGIL